MTGRTELQTAKRRFGWGDVLAGFSVALIAIPQSLAYAELAGMPAYTGLYAVALPALLASFFASSPYLQAGPVATTSLLTLGVLSAVASPNTASYIALANLLALIVGAVRVLVGVLQLGRIAYLLARPVLMGFTTAAALLILLSQLPTALGLRSTGSNVVANAFGALTNPAAWQLPAIGLSVVVILVVFLGRRFHPLFPAVLVAVVAGLIYSIFFGYAGAVIGEIPVGLPRPSLALPLSALPDLLVGGIVIALVGFAEAASISRTYAAQDRMRWRADQEFISQGVANLASGLFGGFPVGASFSRSSVNRLAGARTRWSGAVTGLVVLLFLPFTWLLAELPRAVLAAIVIAAVVNLIRLRELWHLRAYSTAQAYIAWLTFGLTLALSPRIDIAVLIGIALAIAHHLRREQRVPVSVMEQADVLTFAPHGVLWFGSLASVETAFTEALADYPAAKRLELDLGGLGRIDLSAALMLKRLMADAYEAGLEVTLKDVPPMAESWVERVWTDDRVRLD